MSQELMEAGEFRGEIREYGLREYDKSNAMAVAIEVEIHEVWSPKDEQWIDWRNYDVIAHGYLNVVKRDGTLNQKQIMTLIEHAGWDGDFTSIVQHTWAPTPCQFSVKAETYNNQPQYRVNWLNAYDRVPAAVLGNVDENKARSLQDRFGAQVRAIAGDQQRNAQAPKGRPASPAAASRPQAPKPQAANAQAANAAFAEAATPHDDIPF